MPASTTHHGARDEVKRRCRSLEQPACCAPGTDSCRRPRRGRGLPPSRSGTVPPDSQVSPLRRTPPRPGTVRGWAGVCRAGHPAQPPPDPFRALSRETDRAGPVTRVTYPRARERSKILLSIQPGRINARSYAPMQAGTDPARLWRVSHPCERGSRSIRGRPFRLWRTTRESPGGGRSHCVIGQLSGNRHRPGSPRPALPVCSGDSPRPGTNAQDAPQPIEEPQ